MGTNCGCIKQEKELEITIPQSETAVHDKSTHPVKRPNWEDRFTELINNMSISSAEIKVKIASERNDRRNCKNSDRFVLIFVLIQTY